MLGILSVVGVPFCLLYLAVHGSRQQTAFTEYCGKVAAMEGRTAEFDSSPSDDAGMSSFERSLYYDLFRSESRVKDFELMKIRLGFRKEFAKLALVSTALLACVGFLLNKYV